MLRWTWIASAIVSCSGGSSPPGGSGGPPVGPPPTGSAAPPTAPPTLPVNFGVFFEANRVLSAYRARDRAALAAQGTPAAQAEIAALDFADADWRTQAVAQNRGVGTARAQGPRLLVEIAPIDATTVALVALVWRPQGGYSFDGFVRMGRAEYEAMGPRL
jgi:hypothetical protein